MKPLYIFDLDGTLADASHRTHLLEGEKTPEIWNEFFSLCALDKPIPHVIAIFQALHLRADIWIWTGRSDVVMRQTEEWLDEHVWRCSRARRNLRMRPAHNHEPDHVLKKSWLDSMLIEERQRLQAVFEDRSGVVRMWRDAGVPCYQVADGDF